MTFPLELLKQLGFCLEYKPVDEAIVPDYEIDATIDVLTETLGICLKEKDHAIARKLLRSGGIWVIDNRGKGATYEQLTGESPQPEEP